MYLRKKVFLYILLTLISLAFLMSLTSNYFTMKAFTRVEHDFFEHNMRRVQVSLDNEFSFIEKYTADNGHWDTMYTFMEGERDTSRFNEILDPPGLREMDFDILLLVDKSLIPVISYFITDSGEQENLPPEDLENLRKISPLLMKRALEGSFNTMIFIGSRYFFVGVSPIVKSDMTGEAKGFLLMGMDLEKIRNHITSTCELDCHIKLFPEAGVPFRSSNRVHVQRMSEELALIRQVRKSTESGDPSLTVSFYAPRTMYVLGRNAVLKSYLWIFLSGAGILGVIMLLLDSLILKRLKSLRNVSEQIVTEGGIQLRVPVSGSDEISTLSSSFNTMLDTIENLISDIPDSLFISDHEGKILMANKSAYTAICTDHQCQLKGATISSVLKMKDTSKEKEIAGNSLENRTNLIFDNQNVFEAEFIRCDESTFPVEVHRREITFGKRPLMMFLSRDITERKTFERRLARKAYLDDLTGLPNRYAFIEDVNRALKNKDKPDTAFYAAIINMDRFKLINTQIGTFNGDRILLIIGQRLDEFQKDNARLYRIGGDEFAFLVSSSSPQTTRAEATSLMEKIQKAISLPCPVGDEPIFPSASIAVLANMLDCTSSSDVLSRLTQTMKDAKKAGLGFIFFCSDDKKASEPASADILLMSAELHSALEKGEFLPYFQPIYSLPERKIAGFETLVRWNHPVRGLLLPGTFVETAEHIGLAPRIDILMMKQAMESIERLRSLGKAPSHYFSANSSPIFFKASSAVDRIEGILKESGADPSLFILEVTESLLIENLRDVSRMLFRLKAFGIKIALDDFGTGYSSLQYINELPFDFLKLDRSFVSKLLTSEKDERLLKTMINMADELGLEVIAEGVEKEEELLWLEKAGCKKIQGYLFSKPVPWADIERMIREGK